MSRLVNHYQSLCTNYGSNLDLRAASQSRMLTIHWTPYRFWKRVEGRTSMQIVFWSISARFSYQISTSCELLKNLRTKMQFYWWTIARATSGKKFLVYRWMPESES
jgi:hypothetical protein